MDNANRKSIFGNDLLQGTQSNVGFPTAVAEASLDTIECPL